MAYGHHWYKVSVVQVRAEVGRPALRPIGAPCGQLRIIPEVATFVEVGRHRVLSGLHYADCEKLDAAELFQLFDPSVHISFRMYGKDACLRKHFLRKPLSRV